MGAGFNPLGGGGLSTSASATGQSGPATSGGFTIQGITTGGMSAAGGGTEEMLMIAAAVVVVVLLITRRR